MSLFMYVLILTSEMVARMDRECTALSTPSRQIITNDPEKYSMCDYIRKGPHLHNPAVGAYNHYCVILPSGRHSTWWHKVALGTNSNITHKGMPSKHAEIDAMGKIKKWKNLPDEIDIFVIRLTKTGILSESRPCLHCLMSMVLSRLPIRYIYYSTSSGEIAVECIKTMVSTKTNYISSGMRSRAEKSIYKYDGRRKRSGKRFRR